MKKYKFKKEQIWCAKIEIASFIYQITKDFRKLKKKSHPSEISEAEWDEILKKIQWSFKEIKNQYPSEPFPADFEKQEDYKKEVKKYELRLDEGINLFARYIHDFWD